VWLYAINSSRKGIIKNSLEDNLQIGSTLVWLYSKCGQHDYAVRILEAMPDCDAVSWTAMISGYSSLGHNVEALKSLDEMLWDGVTPNTYTYSSALKAFARLEALRDGRKIHGVVNKTQAFSNVFVGCSLIDMYMRCGKVEEARQVFDAMPEHNLVTWKVIITGFAQNGHCQEALKYMYQMQQEGYNADDFILSTVLTSCGNLQKESKCKSLTGSIFGSSVSDKFKFSYSISAKCWCNCTDLVIRVRN
jgi:pentatricopeptide repeat protein